MGKRAITIQEPTPLVAFITTQCSVCCRILLAAPHRAFRASYVCIFPLLYRYMFLILEEVPSRLVLQSFVSSHRSDVFRCTSLADHTFVTPPYACAYSYGERICCPLYFHPCFQPGSKSCGTPLLAVATEEGSVSVLDTSKRHQWDSGKLISGQRTCGFHNHL